MGIKVKGYTYVRNGRKVVVAPYTRKGNPHVEGGGEYEARKQGLAMFTISTDPNDTFEDLSEAYLPEHSEDMMEAAEEFWHDFTYNERHYGKQSIPEPFEKYRKYLRKTTGKFLKDNDIKKRDLTKYLEGKHLGDYKGFNYVKDGEYFTMYVPMGPGLLANYTVSVDRVLKALNKGDISRIKGGKGLSTERVEQLKEALGPFALPGSLGKSGRGVNYREHVEKSKKGLNYNTTTDRWE